MKQRLAIPHECPPAQLVAPLTWLAPFTQRVGDHTYADPAYHEIDFVTHNDTHGDTGEVLFGDMISAELDKEDETLNAQSSETLTSEDLPENAVEVIWNLPVRDMLTLPILT